MDKNRIGQNAGILWHVMDNNRDNGTWKTCARLPD